MGKSSGEMSHQHVVITPKSDEPAEDRHIRDLRVDIRHTRAEMTETIEQLQHRLEPDRIKEQVKASVRAKTIGRAQNMFDSTRSTGFVDRIRQNPLPAAMIAVGLGWLFAGSRSGTSSSDYYGMNDSSTDGLAGMARGRMNDMAGQAQDRMDDLTSRAQDRMDDLTSRAQGQMNDLTGRAQETMSGLSDRARMQASRAQGGFQSVLDDNPLALGVVALAAGAAIGMAVPTTPREHELMGEARDELLDQAQSRAQDAVQKAQKVAKTAVSAAQSATETLNS